MDPLLIAGAGGTTTGILVWSLLTWLLNQTDAHKYKLRLQRSTPSGQGSTIMEAPTTMAPRRDVRLSSLPALDRRLKRISVIPAITLFLQQAGSRLNVGSYLLLHLLCMALGLLIPRWLGLPTVVSLISGVAAGIAPYGVIAGKRQRRLHKLTEQLPDGIRLISSSLRAGLGLDVGLNSVVTELPDPIRSEFRQLVNESLLEFNMNDAFRRFAHRIPLGDYRLFAAAACLHREVGGNFAELLDQLEETVRERFRLYREVKTMTALGRAEGLVLAILPIVVGVAIIILNPNHLKLFLADPFGRKIFTAVIIMQVMGFAMIQWLINPRVD